MPCIAASPEDSPAKSLHASTPSTHVWFTFALLASPQSLNQAPPAAQQLLLPDFLKYPHLEHASLCTTGSRNPTTSTHTQRSVLCSFAIQPHATCARLAIAHRQTPPRSPLPSPLMSVVGRHRVTRQCTCKQPMQQKNGCEASSHVLVCSPKLHTVIY